MKSIIDIRRDNLRQILDSRFGGNQERLADTLDKPKSSISRWLNANHSQPRPISNEIARDFEQILGLETNWLDNVHDDVLIHQVMESDSEYNAYSPQITEIFAELRQMAASHHLNERDFDFLLQAARHIAHLPHYKSKQHPKMDPKGPRQLKQRTSKQKQKSY